ncbi:RCC1 domain-containing protein [Actinoplanes sp. GCM10030250]|uniref:RCC1 domain-containing protein n=1 Tax=Actinoplanes sp. GCM10030250 TaxID=3273376 RepID=UPI003610281A
MHLPLKKLAVAAALVAAVLAVPAPASAEDAAPAIRQVTVGVEHSCSLDDTGSVLCWGDNYFGQLGADGPRRSSVPVPIALPGPATSIAGGAYHTCVIVAADVLCWGDNYDRQLGTANVPTDGAVVKVEGLEGQTPKTVSAGVNSSCVVTESSELYCWGETARQQTHIRQTVKFDVPGTVIAAEVDKWYGCAATTEGPYCWHVEYQGFQRAAGFPAGPAVAITTSRNATCAQTPDDSLYCWGDNFFGSVGDGTMDRRPEAVRIALPAAPTTVGSGENHICAGVVDGAYCWGRNSYGQVGADDPGWALPSPTPVAGLTGAVTSIDGDFSHTCAAVAGEAYCWGINDVGQLGDGTTTSVRAPVKVLAAQA